MGRKGSTQRVLVAVVLAVLVGGGLMAVTPAGAEVAQAATNWTKIWKKKLQPLADRRYYKKTVSDRRYQPKGSYELAGSGYTKVESDAKYQPRATVVTGVYAASLYATAAQQKATSALSFGSVLAVAPQVRVTPAGSDPVAGCSGSVSAPGAAPGVLCIFERTSTNVVATSYCAAPGPACVTSANRLGVYVMPFSAAAGYTEVAGSWALGLP